MRPRGFSRGIYILPNIFTTLNLFCGYFAIVKIIQSVSTDRVEFSKAGAAILIAAIFDGLDGRIARLMKKTSIFGIEYDSLADLTSFCMAPALLVYTWGLNSFGRIGWLAAFLYFGCGALRLARFNAQTTTRDKTFFHGLPTPIAACLITTTVMLHPDLDAAIKPERVYLVFLVYFLALLMVSNIHFRSFKEIDFKKQRSFSVMILLLVSLIVIVAKPVLTLLLFSAGYTLLGVVETFLPAETRKRLQQWLGQTVFDKNSNHDDESKPAIKPSTGL